MAVQHLVLSLMFALAPVAEPEMPPAGGVPSPAQVAERESIATVHSGLPAKPRSTSKDWMLSVEAATWVPDAYSSLFTGIASSASGNTQVAAILTHATLQGRTFRTALGVRPFAGSGLHLDIGYARLSLDGSLAADALGNPVLASQGGALHARSAIDAWQVEIGSQVEGWGVVLGFALGLMRISAAQTSITAPGSALDPMLASAAQQTDAALKSYGYVPTLTLRLGFDVLSLRAWTPPSDRL
jgi:hypothetical protein